MGSYALRILPNYSHRDQDGGAARRLAGRRLLAGRACGLAAGPGLRQVRPLVRSAELTFTLTAWSPENSTNAWPVISSRTDARTSK